MRHAGPVSLQCPGRAWRLLQGSVFALAAASIGAWLAAWAGLQAAMTFAAAGLAALVAAALAVVCMRSHPRQLQWDGAGWELDGQAAAPRLMLDLGHFLLLRLQLPYRAVRWLGVSRREAGPAWHGLRVALLAHGQDGGPRSDTGSMGPAI